MTRTRALLLLGSLATAWLGAASLTRAAVLVPLSLDELVASADLVVLGEVVRRESFWGPERQRIYSAVTVRIERVIKGETTASELTVRRLGGTVDGQTMAVPGSGRLVEGARHLLFLRRGERLAADQLLVVGLAQGIYLVTTDLATGTELAVRDLGGASFARPGPAGPVAAAEGQLASVAPSRLPLAELLQRVDRILAPPAATKSETTPR